MTPVQSEDYIHSVIASRKHNFIFVKTMKTAGTSIELALGPHCGPEDALSPINATYDIQRFVESGIYARDFGPPEIEKRYRKLLNKRNKKLLKVMLRETRGVRLGSHATPLKIRERFGTFWDSAFRFTVERHPYEKAVSLAAMLGTDLMAAVYADDRYVGHPWYTDERGNLIVDQVMLQHRLDQDFAAVLARVGLPSITLPQARRTDRDRTPAREQLTPSQRGFIYERCAREFELFGWER